MVIATLGITGSASARPGNAQSSKNLESAAKKAQTGRVTVGYTAASSSRALAAARAKGGALARGAKAGKYIVVTPPKGVSAEEFAAELKGSAGVAFAEPEVTMQALWTPNDPTLSNPANANYQWGISKDHGINMIDAWDHTVGNAGVVVAVVDSGINQTHPDRPAHIDTANDHDFVNQDATAEDQNGHGTFVAGIIAAATDNGIGMAGVAPGCTILPIRALDENGQGTDVTVSDGIIWAADHGADVINLSVGGPARTQAQVYAAAYARRKGCVLVAASGNDASAHPWVVAYPAGLPGVISVGAIGTHSSTGTFPSWMTSFTARSSFSQYGYGLDLAAPGSSILSLFQTNSYLPEDGTSFAAPHVAGVAALLRSLHGSWSPDEIELVLEQSAHDLGTGGVDAYMGHGRVDAAAALATAEPPVVPQTDEEIPGLPVTASPINSWVSWSGSPAGEDWQGDIDDVYRIHADAGDTIAFTLRGPAPTSDFSPDLDLYLWGPGTPTVISNPGSALGGPPDAVTSNETVSYTVPTGGDGTYYADVYAAEGGGRYTLYWEKGTKTGVSLSAPSRVTLGNTVTLSGALRDGGGSAVSTQTVAIEALPSGSSTWSKVAAPTTGADGRYSAKVKPSRTTKYRARFSGKDGYVSSASSYRTVTAYAYLTTPSGPAKIKKGAKFTSVGYMRPRHAVGSHTVQLRLYRWESGHWKLRKTVRATNVSNTSTTTKYKARYSLPYKGKWKIVAKVKADSLHATTYSTPRVLKVY